MTTSIKTSINNLQRNLLFSSLLAGGLGLAHAGGLDRSNQDISALFEKGGYAELGMVAVTPTLQGRDIATRQTGNILPGYGTGSLAFKQDINPQTSFAVILDESNGVNLKYATASEGASVLLGGTSAKVSTQELKGLARYKFNDALAVHGGLRVERAWGSVTLGGLGYGPLDGYQASLASNTSVGYVVGGSFEMPEKALRIALTYNSAIKHDMGTVENIAAGTGTTSITTPQSVNLNMQTGVAASTLLFANVRWVDWGVYKVSPPAFSAATNGASLTDISDSTTYTLGLAQRFNESLTGLVLLAYEPKSHDMVSPLAAYRGNETFGLGVIYNHGNFRITTVASYTTLGNAQISTGGPAIADFTGNNALALVVRIGMKF